MKLCIIHIYKTDISISFPVLFIFSFFDLTIQCVWVCILLVFLDCKLPKAGPKLLHRAHV